jgi:hypothetical protein
MLLVRAPLLFGHLKLTTAAVKYAIGSTTASQSRTGALRVLFVVAELDPVGRAKVGMLLVMNAVSGVIDWKFAPKWDVYTGLMWTEFNGGLSNSFFVNNNVAWTTGLRLRY